jgi:hypothetical protein
MNELWLQKKLQKVLSEPSKIWITESGRQLQVLSPGRLNPYEGPDFHDFGFILDGLIIVGDAEFHKNASDWKSHNHSLNNLYDNVVLHIVCNNDTLIDRNFETLVIPEKDIQIDNQTEIIENDEIINQLLDLQHYALVRILRKSAEAMSYVKSFELGDALVKATENFLVNYSKKRRRPVYDETKFIEILRSLKSSLIYPFLMKIENNEIFDIFASLIDLMKTKIASEGAALRREILLNVVLPIAICIANDNARINLLTWFWTAEALNTYGNLRRIFPQIDQKYLWQQQGMLEFIREKSGRRTFPPNPLSEYKFDEVLEFYSFGVTNKI